MESVKATASRLQAVIDRPSIRRMQTITYF